MCFYLELFFFWLLKGFWRLLVFDGFWLVVAFGGFVAFVFWWLLAAFGGFGLLVVFGGPPPLLERSSLVEESTVQLIWRHL